MKVNKGYEHLELKLFHSETTGLTFSTSAEKSRYEKVQKQFGEFERYSHTPQIGRDQAPMLEDSLSDVIARDVEQTMETTGHISGAAREQDDDVDESYVSTAMHGGATSSNTNTNTNAKVTSSLPTVKKFNSNVNTKKLKNGKGKGKGGNKKGQSSLAMGGLRLDAKLQQELEELAMVAQATNAMMSTSMPALKSNTNRRTAEMKTNRSDMTRVASSNKTKVQTGASHPPSRFRGDSRGSSGLHIFSRQLDNGTFTPQSLELGLGSTTPHSRGSRERPFTNNSRSNTAQSSIRSNSKQYNVDSDSDYQGMNVSKLNTPTTTIGDRSEVEGGDVFWEGFDESGEVWLAFSQVNETISIKEKVAVRVWSTTGEGTGNTIISKIEMEQYMLQPIQWMNSLDATEMTVIIERLIQCLLSKKNGKEESNFQFLALPRKSMNRRESVLRNKAESYVRTRDSIESNNPSNQQPQPVGHSFGSSPVPPLVFPRNKVSQEDDRLHTPQPLTSHSTSSAVLEISYLPSKGTSSKSGSKKSVLYYEQPPKPVNGSLYAADGSFAYGSAFSNFSQNQGRGSADGSSSRGNSVFGNGSVCDYDSSPRTSLWSASTRKGSSVAGSTHSHSQMSLQKDAPFENDPSRSVSYVEDDEWDASDKEDELKPYVSSDEEDVDDEFQDSHQKEQFDIDYVSTDKLLASSNKSQNQSQQDDKTRSKQTLETAEIVRASLMRTEIDTAYEACDCSLLMELLAIGRTMPKGDAAIHVLVRILDLLTTQDKQDEQEEKRQQSMHGEDIQQSVMNASIRDRFGTEPPQQQHLRELLADASCVECCIETLLAFPRHWYVQIAVANTLTALVTGVDRSVFIYFNVSTAFCC